MIKVEVGYAKVDQQVLIPVTIEEGSNAQQVIELSGVLKKFPEIDMETISVGIFSKACKLQQLVHEGDRVEIYRPLLADPKESRRQRASKNKAINVDADD